MRRLQAAFTLATANYPQYMWTADILHPDLPLLSLRLSTERDPQTGRRLNAEKAIDVSNVPETASGSDLAYLMDKWVSEMLRAVESRL